ncbi:MAG: ATP-dependent Clp protease ATP-binding subunit, partial [Candidatus Margulisbacteria bacterium]|nr:ATP-dependent Clp protease ATP-binding subunit [Candidatus Margulisiibacteriota bacterium]MDD5594347.1 ATP-dependent Clp protease ATP-binding subunit [Candidatus Margulisiibacteriota bacterium]
KSFRPEFLNRVDEAIVFRPLSKEDLETIVDIMIRDVNERLEEKGFLLTLTAKAKKYLVGKSYDPKFGARPLRRAIEEYIEDPLSDQVLRGKFVYGTEIKGDIKKDEFVFAGKPRKIKDIVPEAKPQKKLQDASR